MSRKHNSNKTARVRANEASSGLLWVVLSLSTYVSHAAPVGGEVVSGAGRIVQNGATTTVTQSSPNLSLNWKSFNIAPQETVNFLQPSSSAIAVNRIFDTNGTQILGRLNANGQLWLINPNGILFGQGAQVNVGGLVASSLGLNEGAQNGGTKTFSGAGTGSIINRGTINASNGGYVALLGNQVSNQGTINAHLGAVALGAGNTATLTFIGNSLVGMQVDQSVLNSVAENSGLIRADGGMVIMTAGAKDTLLASVVNNTGVVEARTVEHQEGTIILLGGMVAGTVNVAGTLNASAPESGNGGFIETSAAKVKVENGTTITTAASSGPAGTWLIDPVDFTIAATGGDITGATLSTNLGIGNVVIQSTSGGAGTAGDVNVNDAVTWSANKLTLNAQNNININADLNGSGTAALALEFGQASGVGGNTSNVIVTGGKVNLPAGTTNLTTKQGSDGVVTAYTVITALGSPGSTSGTDLQGVNGGLTANYALGADIDASDTSIWNSGAGFTPIGTYSGTFEGLGHAISNLGINRPTTNNVGLFGSTSNARIQNLSLVNANVTGQNNVGALFGATVVGTAIRNNVSGQVSGSNRVGGMVGYNNTTTFSYNRSTAGVTAVGSVGGLMGETNGGITSAFNSASGNVIGSGIAVGGLVGYNGFAFQVADSHATGSVTGSSDVGGLVGSQSNSVITNSYSTGNASGGAGTGGLVGNNSIGEIRSSHATGSVSGAASSGGLVGSNTSGSISTSYATGSVTGGAGTGGLIGTNTSGPISTSYATGNVSGAAGTGGLIGSNTSGPVSDTYATGSVLSTGAGTGGLIGSSTSGLISNSYSTGSVSSPAAGLGGLIGSGTPGAVSNSYWDTLTSGQSASPGGGEGRNSTQLRQQSNFNTWDFSSTWTIYEGITNPLLRVLMTPLTVTANNDSRTYNGLSFSGGNGVTYSTLINGIAPAGTLSYGGSAQGKTDAGSYAIAPTGLQSNQQYLISFVDGILTINKAALTVSADNQSRLYGQANPVLTTSLSGFVNGENAGTASGFSGSGTASTTATAVTNAGTAVITAGAGTLTATNYDFTPLVDGTLTIGKAHLTVTADDKSRLYGQANPVLTTSLSGFVNGENAGTAAGLSGSGTASTTATPTTNAGTAVITAGAGTLTSTNYDFTALVDGTLTIGKAHLTVTADDKSRLYGQANPLLTTSLSGFVNGENAGTAAGFSGSGTASTTATPTTNAGTAVITADAGTLTATNYDFTPLVDGTLTIGKASLASTVSAADKIYDANTVATVTMGPLSGLVGTETVAVTATGIFDNKNVGTGKTVSVIYTLSNGGNGGQASNYELADANVTATISAADLAITGVTANNKAYDGGTAATLSGMPAVSPLGTDAVAVGGSGTGIFASAAAGNGIAVTVSGFTLVGADAGNYLGIQPSGLTADITARLMPSLMLPTDNSFSQQSWLNVLAQLESELLRFPLVLPGISAGLSPASDAFSPESCIVADIKSALCAGVSLSTLFRVVGEGMRLPEDRIKGGD